MANDWEREINPKPFDAGRFQAERLRRLDTLSLKRELERARRSRADLGLFRRSERLYLNGFIATVQQELTERIAIEGAWDDHEEDSAFEGLYDRLARVDPDAEIDPVLRLQVREDPTHAPPPATAETLAGQAPAIPEFLLSPFEEKALAKLPRTPPEPPTPAQGEAEASGSDASPETPRGLPDFLFERYEDDDRARRARPRSTTTAAPPAPTSPTPEAEPGASEARFPTFLLETWKEEPAAKRSPPSLPDVSEPGLPEILFTPERPPRSNPVETPPAELEPGDAFLLRVETPPERTGILVSIAWAWRCVRDYVESVRPAEDDWEN